MQGSKIVPGGIYAIHDVRYPSGLARFKVIAVVQRRTRNTGSPHDYQSDVEGYVVEEQKDDAPINGVTRSAKSLLGPYEEQVELKARKDAEDAERLRKRQETEDNRTAVVLWLYQFAGVKPASEEDRAYRRPAAIFRRDNSGVEITDNGVRALLQVIEKGGGA